MVKQKSKKKQGTLDDYDFCRRSPVPTGGRNPPPKIPEVTPAASLDPEAEVVDDRGQLLSKIKRLKLKNGELRHERMSSAGAPFRLKLKSKKWRSWRSKQMFRARCVF